MSKNSPGLIVQANRISRGLSQRELAQRTKIPQADICRIETGKLGIGKARAKKFGRAFKLSWRIFMGLPQPPRKSKNRKPRQLKFPKAALNPGPNATADEIEAAELARVAAVTAQMEN